MDRKRSRMQESSNPNLILPILFILSNLDPTIKRLDRTRVPDGNGSRLLLSPREDAPYHQITGSRPRSSLGDIAAG